MIQLAGFTCVGLPSEQLIGGRKLEVRDCGIYGILRGTTRRLTLLIYAYASYATPIRKSHLEGVSQ